MFHAESLLMDFPSPAHGVIHYQNPVYLIRPILPSYQTSVTAIPYCNLNQVQMANELNVSKQTVSNWENNNILPSIEMLVKISRFFSVSTDYLLELDDRNYIEITGLSGTQLTRIQQIICDIIDGKD